MARSILALTLLIVSSGGLAVDIPLSDVPLAPLPVTAVAAAASENAVLALYSVNGDLYV